MAKNNAWINRIEIKSETSNRVYVVAQHAGPAVAKAEEAVVGGAQAGAYDGADDGVEARTVASAGQQAYAHAGDPKRLSR